MTSAAVARGHRRAAPGGARGALPGPRCSGARDQAPPCARRPCRRRRSQRASISAPERVALVTQAALIHDVGLIAATGDGTIAAEFAHPAVGADMAALVPGAAELAPVIRAHHEWWDGFGFPNGLLGEAIPTRGARARGRRVLRRDPPVGPLTGRRRACDRDPIALGRAARPRMCHTTDRPHPGVVNANFPVHRDRSDGHRRRRVDSTSGPRPSCARRLRRRSSPAQGP